MDLVTEPCNLLGFHGLSGRRGRKITIQKCFLFAQPGLHVGNYYFFKAKAVMRVCIYCLAGKLSSGF